MSDACVQGVTSSRDAQTDPDSTFSLSPEEADAAAEKEDIRANAIRANSAAESAPDVCRLVSDQCSWCGFKCHSRKSKYACPQHPNYEGHTYEKGSKVSPEWVPGTRASHSTGSAGPPLTEFSVRSAPSDSDFKVKD